MTRNGIFLTRTEAADIALSTGQVKEMTSAELYSEDLWTKHI